MSVYVDNHRSPRPGKFHGWSHLAAETDEELHVFAARIGLKRGWFQPNALMNHYDVSENKRRQAIRAGAIPLTARELVIKVHDKQGLWPNNRSRQGRWPSVTERR